MRYFYSVLLPVALYLCYWLYNFSNASIRYEWILSTHPAYTIDEVIESIADECRITLQQLKTISEDKHIYLVSYRGRLGELALKDCVFAHSMVKHFSKNANIVMRDKRPNDPRYDVSQWPLETIEAPVVWSYTTGGETANWTSIVVAVVDDGFELTHDDLRDNLWIYPDEIPNDGIDNDENGFIDDQYGWDAKNNTGIRSKDYYHGTGVAGIVGAKGNNRLGIAGVNWDVKILPISIDRNTTVDVVLSAYNYISRQRSLYNQTNGTKGAYIVVTNNSFGANNTKPEDFPEWCDYYDSMGELGILSVAATTNSNVNVEEVGDLPSNCTSKYLIAVTGTGKDDSYSGAGYGNKSVDLAAPGNGTLTLSTDNSYAVLGSNSSASPHVAGAIALLYSLECTYLDNLRQTDNKSYVELVKNAIFNGVDIKDDLKNITVTEGRLNIAKSLEFLTELCANSIEHGEYAIENLYPNPNIGHFNVEYQSPDAQEQLFDIYTSNGQFVKSLRHNPLQSGMKTLTVYEPDLPNGAYFLRLNTQNKSITKPFVVSKELK